MDLIKIIDKEAFFCLPNEANKIISQVTTGDINKALGFLLESNDVGLATNEDSTVIANPAQRIIFEQLRASFKEALDSRETIKAEIDSVFAQAEAKYLKTEE